MVQVTQLRPWGFGGSLYGSFSGKKPYVPPAPPTPSVLPHDDYDGPSWLDTSGRTARQEARLRRMREEIGLIAKPETPAAKVAVETAVAEAAQRLIARPKAPKNEREAFDFVASYARQYRKALKSILADARREDIEAAFRADVRAKVVAAQEAKTREAKRQAAIEREDREIEMILAYFS